MSDEEFGRQHAEAVKRGEERMKTEPRAVSARYDRRGRRIVVEFIDGCTADKKTSRPRKTGS